METLGKLIFNYHFNEIAQFKNQRSVKSVKMKYEFVGLIARAVVEEVLTKQEARSLLNRLLVGFEDDSMDKETVLEIMSVVYTLVIITSPRSSVDRAFAF